MMILITLAACASITLHSIYAQDSSQRSGHLVGFDELDLSSKNQLLFRANVTAPGFSPYSSLFLANINPNGSHVFEQLTFFPEKMTILTETRQLQIQNRFGVFRTDSTLSNLAPVRGYPAFVNGQNIRAGKINPITESPNGRYLLYLQERSAAFGDLVLHDLAEDTRVIVAAGLTIDLNAPPVSWAPNSEFFIYSKENAIYYFALSQYRNKRVLTEPLRQLGAGTIASIRWGLEGELYYISGSLIYQINPSELFARNIYADLLHIGKILGKISLTFDPSFDHFWISPNADKLLFNKGGRSLFLYILRNDNFVSAGETIRLPYLYMPSNITIRRIVWSRDDIITILAQSLVGQASANSVFRMEIENASLQFSFNKTIDRNVRDIVMSPNERLVALLTEDRVIIKNYEQWSNVLILPHDDPLHVVWNTSNRVIIGGAKRIEQIQFTEPRNPQLVALSQTDAHGFIDNTNNTIFSQIENDNYIYENGDWQQLPENRITQKDPAVSSSDVRLYLQELTTGNYRNIIMIRNIRNVGTNPLFNPPNVTYESFPVSDDPINFDYFTHGSRFRGRRVALTFDGIDSAEGLITILNTLKNYNIRATFFLNGEFIERNPDAARAIVDSEHEVGSLFFAYFDMTDTQYRITEDFIRQGLARNEDIYFSHTQKELALLWHAPYYAVNPVILRGAQTLNYTYVGRDVDSVDWVPRRGTANLSASYLSSGEIIERIIEKKKPGSIISLRIGIPQEEIPFGGRDDYLFRHLDLLIDQLIQRGYSVVPVSELIESAK